MRLGFIFILYVSITSHLYSQQVELVKEYTYKAGDHDSKISSREKAINTIKSLAIEEMGSTVLSLQNYRVEEEGSSFRDYYKSKIKVFASTMTQLKIIDESWNGEEYYLKAAIQLNQHELKEKLDELVKAFLENTEEADHYPKWLRSVMKKEIHLGEGIGELEIGMSQPDVVKLLGNPIENKTEKLSNSSALATSFYYRYKLINLSVGFVAGKVQVISYSDYSSYEEKYQNISPVLFGLKIGSSVDRMTEILGQEQDKELYENGAIAFHAYNGVSIGVDIEKENIYCFQIRKVN